MPLYLARWPDRSATLVKACGPLELFRALDDIADPNKCRVRQYDGPMAITFQLKERPVEPLGTLEAVEDIVGRKADTAGDVEALVEDFSRLLDGDPEDSFADVRFVLADGKQVMGHRAVLAARCEYFRKLFRTLGEDSGRVELPEVGASAFKRVLRYLYTGSPDFSPPTQKLWRSGNFAATESQVHAIARMNKHYVLLFEILALARKFDISDLAALIEINMAERFEGSFNREELTDLASVLEGADAFELRALKSHCLHLFANLNHQEHYMWGDEDLRNGNYCLPPALRHLPLRLQQEVESSRKAAGQPTFSSYIIRQAVIEKDRDAILKFVQERGSLNKNPSLGCLVHFVVGRQDLDFLRFFLNLKPNVNFQDINGNTPLHIAAGMGNPDVVQALLMSGAKVQIHNKEGRTPFDCLNEFRRNLFVLSSTDSPAHELSDDHFEDREEAIQYDRAEMLLKDALNREEPQANGVSNSTSDTCLHSGTRPGSGDFAFDTSVLERWWQDIGTPDIELETGQQNGSAGASGCTFMNSVFAFMFPHTHAVLQALSSDQQEGDSMEAKEEYEAIRAVEGALVHDFEGDQPKVELDPLVRPLTEVLAISAQSSSQSSRF